MSNTKRLLALTLALVMIFSLTCGSFAFAAADDGEIVEEAVAEDVIEEAAAEEAVEEAAPAEEAETVELIEEPAEEPAVAEEVVEETTAEPAADEPAPNGSEAAEPAAEGAEQKAGDEEADAQINTHEDTAYLASGDTYTLAVDETKYISIDGFFMTREEYDGEDRSWEMDFYSLEEFNSCVTITVSDPSVATVVPIWADDLFDWDEETGDVWQTKYGLESSPNSYILLKIQDTRPGSTTVGMEYERSYGVFWNSDNPMNPNYYERMPYDDYGTETAYSYFDVNVTGEISAYTTGLALDRHKLTINGGEPVQLNAEITPANGNLRTVHWTSTDPSIATVDENGLVTPVASGTTTIVAVNRGGVNRAEFYDSCVVTVSRYATSIKLDRTAYTLANGSSFTLTPTVLPASAVDQNVHWSSSDESIAAVDGNGTVTAVGPGTATITATNNGETAVSAACTVTVVEAGSHTHDSIVFTEWNNPTSLPTTAGNYCLTADVELSETWSAPNGTRLCLNGHSITMIDSSKNVIRCWDFSLYDCVGSGLVTGGANGVYVESRSLTNYTNFYLYGGEISGNSNAGVNGSSGFCNINLYGGTITNNGTGVSTNNQGSHRTGVRVSGDIKVTGNRGSDIWLAGYYSDMCTVDVVGDLTEDALIGVEFQRGNGNPANRIRGLSGHGTVENFFCNDPAYELTLDADGNGQIGVPATSITISQSEMSLPVHDSAVLSASVGPDNATDKAVAWSSSDLNVATVDAKGNVTAIGGGEAVITATVHGNVEITATCLVTVTSDPVESITIPGEIVLKTQESFSFDPVVKPIGKASKAVTWTIADESEAGMLTIDENGVLTALKEGHATVTATAADGSGVVSNPCTVRVSNLEARAKIATIGGAFSDSLDFRYKIQILDESVTEPGFSVVRTQDNKPLEKVDTAEEYAMANKGVYMVTREGDLYVVKIKVLTRYLGSTYELQVLNGEEVLPLVGHSKLDGDIKLSHAYSLLEYVRLVSEARGGAIVPFYEAMVPFAQAAAKL